MYNFEFLPVEVQARIKALHDLPGVPEPMLESLIDSILHASEVKTTSLQMDIDRIENSITQRLDRIGSKMESDVQTRLGASNQMIVDIHTLVQSQEAVVQGLRAEFHDSMQTLGERVTDNTARIEDLEQKVIDHDESRDRSIEERQLLRQDMDESKAHRARMQQTLDTELPAIREAIEEIQRLLEIAGNHEAGG